MKWISDISFVHPWAFLLLLLVAALMLRHFRTSGRQAQGLNVPSLHGIKNVRKSFRERLFSWLPWMQWITMVLIIIAVARPQSQHVKSSYSIDGIDIMLVNDVSGTMLAEDLKPNRLEAAKSVAATFIDGRPQDRIGLVAFSGVAFTQCPLTADHSALKMLLMQIKNGIVRDGTAIGDAVGTAVDRLRSSKAVSKVIILLTDGINNSGFIDPMDAASMASLYGIRLYTVGVGSRGEAPFPVQGILGTQYTYEEANIDEPLLQKMAETTGGRYFRATDNASLEAVYKDIDAMEKTRIDVARMTDKKDVFFWPVLAAALLLAFSLLLKLTILRTLP